MSNAPKIAKCEPSLITFTIFFSLFKPSFRAALQSESISAYKSIKSFVAPTTTFWLLNLNGPPEFKGIEARSVSWSFYILNVFADTLLLK